VSGERDGVCVVDAVVPPKLAAVSQVRWRFFKLPRLSDSESRDWTEPGSCRLDQAHSSLQRFHIPSYSLHLSSCFRLHALASWPSHCCNHWSLPLSSRLRWRLPLSRWRLT